MPSLKEIKNRIASVNSTRKITSAMKMVASSKLHHAQVMIENMLPYEGMLEHILKTFLASDVDGLHEIVYGNGILFPHEDSRSFAEEIMKLDANPTYKADIIKRCKEKAIQYDINVMAEKYMNIYKQLVK